MLTSRLCGIASRAPLGLQRPFATLAVTRTATPLRALRLSSLEHVPLQAAIRCNSSCSSHRSYCTAAAENPEGSLTYRKQKAIAFYTRMYERRHRKREKKAVAKTLPEHQPLSEAELTLPVVQLLGEQVSTRTLDATIFDMPLRVDILHNCVLWSRAAKRQGTASAKTKAEVSGTGKKPFPQKGRGAARHGSLRNPQFRGGGRAFPPKPKDWSFKLNKKYVRLGVRTALSAKMRRGEVLLLEDGEMESHRTAPLKEWLAKQGIESALILYGDQQQPPVHLTLAARNIPKVDMLPAIGANVYDLLNHKWLVLTCGAVEHLEGRLNPAQYTQVSHPWADQHSTPPARMQQ